MGQTLKCLDIPNKGVNALQAVRADMLSEPQRKIVNAFGIQLGLRR